jgi:hypothetical protein
MSSAPGADILIGGQMKSCWCLHKGPGAGVLSGGQRDDEVTRQES